MAVTILDKSRKMMNDLTVNYDIDINGVSLKRK